MTSDHSKYGEVSSWLVFNDENIKIGGSFTEERTFGKRSHCMVS